MPQGIHFGDESHSEGIPKGPEMGPEMDRVGSSAVRMVICAQKKNAMINIEPNSNIYIYTYIYIYYKNTYNTYNVFPCV